MIKIKLGNGSLQAPVPNHLFPIQKFQSIKGCTQNLQDNDGGTWQADPKIAKVVFIEGPNDSNTSKGGLRLSE